MTIQNLINILPINVIALQDLKLSNLETLNKGTKFRITGFIPPAVTSPKRLFQTQTGKVLWGYDNGNVNGFQTTTNELISVDSALKRDTTVKRNSTLISFDGYDGISQNVLNNLN